jgi:hypothetical protein
MELILLGRLFSECRNLFFGLSLFLRKGHPFANDFSARLVIFHVRDPWVSVTSEGSRVTYGRVAFCAICLVLLVLRGLCEVSVDRSISNLYQRGHGYHMLLFLIIHRERPNGRFRWRSAL